jgi:hypothetical protein
MSRPRSLFLSVLLLNIATFASAQVAAVPGAGGRVPSAADGGLRRNSIQAVASVAVQNAIIMPVPLSAKEKESALAAIDKHLIDEVAQLQQKLTGALPDELAVLAKTAGWKTDHQQKLLVAVRTNDPAAVFEAWSAGNPQDAAGAEIASRQTDAKRLLVTLLQDAEKKPTALRQHVSDLDAALGKLASTPALSDASAQLATLKNWVEARRLVDAAVIGKGSTAALPKGKITLIYEPNLSSKTAIVLNAESMLVGNQGRGAFQIVTGNAAEALGLPIVTGDPLEDADRDEMTGGIMLLNRSTTKAAINYDLAGTKYAMEPGMAQRLADDNQLVVTFDRGENFGLATNTLTPGTYAFTPSDTGWQLFKERFDVVLDNTQSKQEFNFVFHGENHTVPAGATRTLTSDYPIVIGYDRGNGSDYALKIVHNSGNVQIGVNAVDNLWDLFPTTDNQRENSKLKLFQ